MYLISTLCHSDLTRIKSQKWIFCSFLNSIFWEVFYLKLNDLKHIQIDQRLLIRRKLLPNSEKLFTENLFTEKLFCLPKNFSVYRKSFSFIEKLFFVIIWIDFRITKKIFGKQNRFSVDEKDLDLIKRVNTCMIISINM